MRVWDDLLTQLSPAVAERRRQVGDWRGERLYQHVERWAAERGDGPAILDSRGGWTYAQLGEHVDALVGALVDLGVEPGDVVAHQLPNWRESNALVIACSRIGAVFTSIAPIFRGLDLGRMLQLAEPKVFVTVDSFRGYEHARPQSCSSPSSSSPPSS